MNILKWLDWLFRDGTKFCESSVYDKVNEQNNSKEDSPNEEELIFTTYVDELKVKIVRRLNPIYERYGIKSNYIVLCANENKNWIEKYSNDISWNVEFGSVEKLKKMICDEVDLYKRICKRKDDLKEFLMNMNDKPLQCECDE